VSTFTENATLIGQSEITNEKAANQQRVARKAMTHSVLTQISIFSGIIIVKMNETIFKLNKLRFQICQVKIFFGEYAFG